MSNLPELLCIGESMVLFVPAEDGPPEQVRSWTRTIGGAESNVACNLAALGLRSRWVSAVGDDPFGRALVAEVASAGVDVSDVQVDPARPTGLYIKESGAGGSPVRYYRTGSAAAGLGPELLSIVDFGTADVVHLSGITAALSDSCLELVRAILDRPRDGTRISFDLNLRPVLWRGRDHRAVLTELASRCDIVLAGDDEAELVWGTGDPRELRARLPEPATLVIKHGERGATLLEGDAEPVFAPALRVDVVEPVGAGDAFAAGFLAATLRGEDPLTRLRSGHLQAAATLLTQHDVGRPLPGGVVSEMLAADEAAWAGARLTGQGMVHA